jgi:hypothetical protein
LEVVSFFGVCVSDKFEGVNLEDEARGAEADDPIVQSKKPEVVEIVFDRLIGADEWPVDRPLVADSDLLVEAIIERNARHPKETKKLSTKNPANFLKDFIRKRTCNKNWPKRLSDKKITARQVYGDGQIFEFVAFGEDDSVPFPDRFDPEADLDIHPFEALSIPVEARKLGRQDEPWLIQVAVSQRLITTHLAIEASNKGLLIETLAHLQVSVKTQPEIDATFVATIRTAEGKRSRAYVTVEAKQIGERILEHQIREQVGIAFASTVSLSGEDAINAVLPIVVQVVNRSGETEKKAAKRRQYVYIAQFELIKRPDFDAKYTEALHDLPLKIQSAALYEPYPSIAGISYKPVKSRSV